MNQNASSTTSETKNQNYLKDFKEKTDKGSKKSSTTITTTTFKDSKPTTENTTNSKNNGIITIDNCSLILKTTNTNTKKASSTTNSALISTKTLQKTSPQPTPTTIRKTETTTEAREKDRSNTPTTPTTTRQLSTTTTTFPSFHLKQLQFLLLLLVSHYFSVAFTAEDEVTLQINGKASNTTFNGGQHVTHASLLISRQNSSFTIDLLLNTVLLSSSFSEKVISQNSSYYLHSNQSEEFCYYVGSVRGELDSSAAFATCPVFRGFFRVREKTWHVTTTQDGVHQITMETNNNITTWFCGVEDLKKRVDILLRDGGNSKRRRRSVVEGYFEDMLVVELYLANDVTRFRQYGNVEGVFRSSKEIANVANLMYQQMGIMVVLVGVEVWTDRDKIFVSPDSKATLKEWMLYRATKVDTYNDVGFFISNTVYESSTLGLAHISTMCSQTESGGIIQSIVDRSDVSGAILAHEIGHNFGLSHDIQDCTCGSGSSDCIMSPRASKSQPNQYFSTCSKDQMLTSMSKGFDICLHNTPQTLNQYLAVCGNGILEVGEQCDCGGMPSFICNQQCCNSTTCQLRGECAQGGCCDVTSCSLRKVGHVCRPEVAGACDLAESCDGKSAFCPEDTFVHEGTACSAYGKEGSCFGGVCRNREGQCKLLYGDQATDGSDECYGFNRKGTVHGYCGYLLHFESGIQNEYFKCLAEDIFCGCLQCDSTVENFAKYPKFVTRSKKNIGTAACSSVILDYGKQVTDPGFVPDGSPCGTDKVCLSNKCVERESLLATKPCYICVNGRCNNKGFCHCDPGFAGLTCEQKQNSGQTGVVVGLIIFFLILLILIALFVYDYRHKQHTIKFFKGLADAYMSRAASKTTQPPTKAPPSIQHYKGGHDNAMFSMGVPEISVIPSRTAPKPSKILPTPPAPNYKDFNNNFNPKKAGGFDNPALVCEELNVNRLGNSKIEKPPIPKPPVPNPLVPKPFVPNPYTKTSENNLRKPTILPPPPPVLQTISQPAKKQSTTNPSTTSKPKQPPRPTIPNRPSNPPRPGNNVNDVVRKLNQLQSQSRLNDSIV